MKEKSYFNNIYSIILIVKKKITIKKNAILISTILLSSSLLYWCTNSITIDLWYWEEITFYSWIEWSWSTFISAFHWTDDLSFDEGDWFLIAKWQSENWRPIGKRNIEYIDWRLDWTKWSWFMYDYFTRFWYWTFVNKKGLITEWYTYWSIREIRWEWERKFTYPDWTIIKGILINHTQEWIWTRETKDKWIEYIEYRNWQIETIDASFKTLNGVTTITYPDKTTLTWKLDKDWKKTWKRNIKYSYWKEAEWTFLWWLENWEWKIRYGSWKDNKWKAYFKWAMENGYMTWVWYSYDTNDNKLERYIISNWIIKPDTTYEALKMING